MRYHAIIVAWRCIETSKFIDLTNKNFGYWKVLKFVGKNTRNHAVWLCLCTLCGKEKEVISTSLVNGKSTKCRSCSNSEAHRKSFANDPIKFIFKGMKQRCYNPNVRSYKNYGAKGITVCKEWLSEPIRFYEWAYANGYGKGMSIERKDVTKGYSPQNCCFIPKEEQSKNRSVFIMVTINNKTKCLSDWARIYNINASTVKARVRLYGMTYEEALSTPVNKHYSRR